MVLHTIMLIVAACVTKAGSKLLESVYRVVPAYRCEDLGFVGMSYEV
jgi:hypothetical protein